MGEGASYCCGWVTCAVVMHTLCSHAVIASNRHLPPLPLAIPAWIERQQAAGQVPRSPLTNQPLGDLSLRPNHALASLITGLRAGGQLGGGRTVGRQHGTALATGLS